MKYASLVLLLTVAACSKNAPIEPEPSQGGDEVKPAPTGCPQGLPGPKLIALPAADGSTYCMDQREVTWNEYKEFAKAKGIDTSGQPSRCSWNDDFMPLSEGSMTSTPPYYCSVLESLEADGNLPAKCVDFCDAWSYCAWAGKRLCSETGAQGANTIAAKDWDGASADAKSQSSEWTNACSQGGKTTYAYGDTLDNLKCITEEWHDAGKSLAVRDTASRDCHGSMPPFDQIYDLNGSVAEWVSSCNQGGDCIARGSSPFIKGVEECDATLGLHDERAQSASVGIRCCADAVPAKPSDTPAADAGK